MSAKIAARRGPPGHKYKGPELGCKDAKFISIRGRNWVARILNEDYNSLNYIYI